jgi:hypothetical protein
VNVILKNNKDINIIYREETTLAKYITVVEKGVIVSTPLIEPTGLSTFKKLMESYKQELNKSTVKQHLRDLDFWELIYEGPSAKIYFGERKSSRDPVAIKVAGK